MLRAFLVILLLAAASARAAIDTADILGQAHADEPFNDQSGWTGQFLGTHPDGWTIPESGVHGAPLANGETLRFGKVDDPARPGRKALQFVLAPDDPVTSSSKRAEIAFRHNIEHGRVYWLAFSLYVFDWGTLPPGDQSLLGTQLHSGDDNRGLSPSFTLGAFDDNMLGVTVRHSYSADPSQSNTESRTFAQMPIPFGRWIDFVFRFRLGQDEGELECWMDAREIVDYRGPLGFNTPGHNDYVKFGYYNWSTFGSSRKILLRSPLVVLDPTGNKYREADLRSFVRSRS